MKQRMLLLAFAATIIWYLISEILWLLTQAGNNLRDMY